MEKTINILGEEVKIAFNMAVEINYENIVGEAFDVTDLQKTKNTLVLYLAAIIANNPDSQITFNDLLYKATLPEIAALRTAVVDCMTDWMQIPEVMKKEKKEEEEEDNVKNV